MSDAAVPDPVRFRWSVIPHTHWDREWYVPFEPMRMRLADTLDEVADVLEADPRFGHWMLDGQAVPLEDLEELRGHGSLDRLRALNAAGRLAVGPAYVLAEEFLVGGETLVRDWLVGLDTCRRLGFRPMRVGYSPDTFGHIAQLPQILAGFGLRELVFWRGLGDEADTLGAVFRWEAPDGTAVLGVRQLGGYSSADQLGRWGRAGEPFHDRPDRWADVTALRFVRQLESWGGPVERSGIRSLFLQNGTDHRRIQPDLPDLLDAARERLPGLEVAIEGHEAYLERLHAEVDGLPPQRTVRGELTGAREIAVLRGISSARRPLKVLQERSERALLSAEMLVSLAHAAGAPVPTAALGRAWRQLLRNAPHDSISGCSVDAVHREMETRYATVEQIADRLAREATAALAGTTEPWTPSRAPAASLALLNLLPWAATRPVELSLPAPLLAEACVSGRAAGRVVPVQRLAPDRVLVAPLLPGLSASDITLCPGAGTEPPTDADAVTDGRWLTNGLVALRVVGDELVLSTLSHDPVIVRTALRFEDEADRGDEYTFGPAGDAPIAAVLVSQRTVETGPVRAAIELVHELAVPARFDRAGGARSDERVIVRATTTLSLASGEPVVRARTVLVDHAHDHRLRLVLAAPDATDRVRAEGHFAVLERRAGRQSEGVGWPEAPVPTAHSCGFVAAGSLFAWARAVPEHEARPRPDGGLDLCLTLLRCVGWLSVDDNPARPGGAGPHEPVPDAQCDGEHVVEWAIAPAGRLPDLHLAHLAETLRATPVVAPAGARLPDLGITAAGPLPLLVALKPAEDGDGLVLRVSNPSREETVTIGLDPAWRPCRLDEAPAGARTDDRVVLPPGRIASFRRGVG